MDTTRLKELLTEFKNNGISHETKKLQPVLDFQDVIGRARESDITIWYSEQDQRTKELFIWIVFCTMAKDTALDILRKVVCQSIIDTESVNLHKSFHDRFAEVSSREIHFRTVENENIDISGQNKNMRETITELQAENRELRTAADKYNQIRNLLN